MASINRMLDEVKRHLKLGTDADLADHYGVNRQAVSRWRNDKQEPHGSTLLKLHEDYRAALHHDQVHGATKEDWRRRARSQIDRLEDPDMLRQVAILLKDIADDEPSTEAWSSAPKSEPGAVSRSAWASLQHALDRSMPAEQRPSDSGNGEHAAG